MGWGGLKNGDLLREAEGQFEVFISTDQNLKYQQQALEDSSLFWFCRPTIGQPSALKAQRLRQRSRRSSREILSS
jgi:hypothetical protein